LKDKFLLSENLKDQKVFMHMIMMLQNFWTHCVGLSQLSSTYYPVFHNIGDDMLLICLFKFLVYLD